MNEEKTKAITQKDRVLSFLQSKGKITQKEAFEMFGLTCLQVIIKELRKEHDIETIMTESKNRYGEPTRFGIYTYHGALK